jgi:hypothetical protein
MFEDTKIPMKNESREDGDHLGQGIGEMLSPVSLFSCIKKARIIRLMQP